MKLTNKNMNSLGRYEFFKNQISRNGKILYAGNILKQAYKDFPENIALIYKDEKISYKDLYYRSCLFSKKLKEHGVGESDVVLIFFRNSTEFYITYFAIWQLGAVVAPLNIYLKEQELRHIVSDSNAKLAVIDSQKSGIFKDLGIRILTESDIDLNAKMPDYFEDINIPEREENEIAALLYTSGTTGLPKGVMLSSKNIMTNMLQVISIIDFNETKSVYCVLPLFHCFAQNCCVWSAIYSSSTVIIVPKISRSQMLSALKYKPKIFLGVPALYGLLCMLKTAPIKEVEYFVCGGDALPDKIRQIFALIYGRKICNGYGLTETSPVISVDMEDFACNTSSVGYPVVDLNVQIRDDENNILKAGEIGQLWVSGPSIMLGYYNEKEKTDQMIKDGWLATGDLARIDENGKIIICGRIRDIISQKGVKIYPQEVENVILKHKDVMTVGVVGQKDSIYGEVPVAFVNLINKNSNIEQELRDLCSTELALYKVPRKFFVLDEMPLTATGKVDKNVLRKKIQELN